MEGDRAADVDFYPPGEDFATPRELQEEPQEMWYFTRLEERHGPVSLGELKAMVLASAINPYVDLVWTKGMEEWKLAAEIRVLFDRPVPPPVTHQLPAPSLIGEYPAPKDRTLNDAHLWEGSGRSAFILGAVIFPILVAAGMFYGMSYLRNLSEKELDLIRIGAGAVTGIIFLLYSLRRLVNLGMSRWWIFASLVPFLNLWIGYRCCACPPGFAFNRKMDIAGIFLAAIYWLLIAGGGVMASWVASGRPLPYL